MQLPLNESNHSDNFYYESHDALLKPTLTYTRHLYCKENSHAELIHTPIKLPQKRNAHEITPFSILKSHLEDSACIQTRSRKLHDSALPQEHWKLYSSNIKKPESGRTPFEEFFDISGRKQLEFREYDSEAGGLTPFGGSMLKKRAELEYSDVKQPKLLAPAPLDGVISALNAKSNNKADGLATKNGELQQKTGGCNCEKSKCLQMYCDCFKYGGFCGPNCFCFNCENKNDNENRKRKIVSVQKKNPHIFVKAVVSDSQGATKVASKGCNCRKSGCLKKYCECHQAGAMCTDACKCKDCKNMDCGDRKHVKEAGARKKGAEKEFVGAFKRRLFEN